MSCTEKIDHNQLSDIIGPIFRPIREYFTGKNFVFFGRNIHALSDKNPVWDKIRLMASISEEKIEYSALDAKKVAQIPVNLPFWNGG